MLAMEGQKEGKLKFRILMQLFGILLDDREVASAVIGEISTVKPTEALS